MSSKKILTNFADRCYLNGASTKFLRFRNTSKYNATIRVSIVDDSIEVEKNYTGIFPIYLNLNRADKLPDNFVSLNGTHVIEAVKELGNINTEFAYMLTCDNVEASIKFRFDITFDGTQGSPAFDYDEYLSSPASPASPSSPGSPEIPSDETIFLEVKTFRIAKPNTSTNFNKFPIHEKTHIDVEDSYTLLRTNPLMTGNIKLTVDLNENLALNTMDANNVLSDVKYKNFVVSHLSNYAADIRKFLDDGKMKEDVIFDVKEDDTAYTKTNASEQVNDFYQYGVSQCVSPYNDEEFQLFAPLWLTKNIPEFFVVFKAKHAVSKASYDGGDANSIFKDVIANAEIIQTFDMREGSKLGTYLRTIVNNTNFSNDPLNVTIGDDSTTTWNGIAYDEGQFACRGELTYDTYSTDSTIKDTESYIINGFKRNKIITQNIINLEFLFNDDESDFYSINRYFGLYVNAIDICKFDVSNDIISRNKKQLPQLRFGVDGAEYSLKEFSQYNENGIQLPVMYDIEAGEMVQKYPEETEVNDPLKMYVIVDRNNKLHRIKSGKSITNEVYDGRVRPYMNYTMFDTSMKISDIKGIDNIVFNPVARFVDENPAQMQLALYSSPMSSDYVFAPNEYIEIYFENAGELQYKWRCIANATNINESECWEHPVYDISCSTYKNTFNPFGSPEAVANALAECINSFETTIFEAVAVGNNVVIVSKFKDESGNALRLKRVFYTKTNENACKSFDTDTISEFDGEVYYEISNFSGGNTTRRNIAIITKDDSYDLKKDYYFQVNINMFSKIKNYKTIDNPILSLPYIAEPIRDDSGKLIGFKDYDKYRMMEIENEEPFIYDTEHRIIGYELFKPSFKLLSFCPVKDFDFSFYNTDYMNSPIAELLDYFETVSLEKDEEYDLDRNEYYYITEGEGKFTGRYDDYSTQYVTEYSTEPFDVSDSFKKGDIIQTYLGINERIKCTSENLQLLKYKYNNVNNGDNVDNDDNDDNDMCRCSDNIRDFVGFKTLSAIVTTEDEEMLSELKANNSFDRFLYMSLRSEYDRLEENAQTKWANKSIVTPTITKWVSEGSDAHGNPYRLNFSEAFGATNFSPSFTIENDPTMLTHEWAYLDEFPLSYKSEYVENSSSYMFTSISDKGTKDDYKSLEKRLLDENTDYFTKYFTTGKNMSNFNDSDIEYKTQQRYSIVHWSDTLNSHYTLFRGVKVNFKEFDKYGVFDGDAKDYEGYKFAAVLSRFDTTDSPFEITLYDNKKFKTLTLVIKADMSTLHSKTGLSFLDLYTSGSVVDYNSFTYNEDENGVMKSTITVEEQYADVRMTDNTITPHIGIYEKGYRNTTTLREIYGIDFDEITESEYSKYKNSDDNYIQDAGLPSTALIQKPMNSDLSMVILENLFADYTSYEQGNAFNTITTTGGVSIQCCNSNTDSSESREFSTSLTNTDPEFNEYADEAWKINGGKNASFLDKIVSFAGIKRLVDSGLYKYKTNEKTHSIKLSFIAPSQIIGYNELINDVDEDKPSRLKASSVIGFSNTATENAHMLYRYGGNYRPKFKNAIEFNANETMKMCKKYGYDFLTCNTTFADNNRQSILSDFGINKYADSEILPIDDSMKVLSQYPYLDYITTAQVDRCIAKSNWDKNYFRKYSDVHIYEQLDGTINTKEFKSFIGSKVMNIQDSFYFTKYDKDRYKLTVVDSNTQNTVESSTNPQASLLNNKFTIEFDMYNVLLDYMCNDGADTEMKWIGENMPYCEFAKMSDTRRKEYAKKYLEDNIMKLFKISSVIVYNKQSMTQENVFVDSIGYMKVLDNGFEPYKNSVVKLSDNNLGLTVDINLDFNKFYAFVVYVEISRI